VSAEYRAIRIVPQVCRVARRAVVLAEAVCADLEDAGLLTAAVGH
jgi:hypothetical protein